MPVTVSRDKWILYKHTCNYEMIKAVALDVKNSCKTDVSDLERHRMQERLAALDLYRTRNPEERPLDSINHRINTLEFWMFGYEDMLSKTSLVLPARKIGILFPMRLEETKFLKLLQIINIVLMDSLLRKQH